MTYRILFRTTDRIGPGQFAFIDSETHVQELEIGDYVCLKMDDLARTDAHWLSHSPQPVRIEGHAFVPMTPPYPSDWTRVGSVRGNAVVYAFATEEEMRGFCDATGAIEATMFQQSPAL